MEFAGTSTENYAYKPPSRLKMAFLRARAGAGEGLYYAGQEAGPALKATGKGLWWCTKKLFKGLKVGLTYAVPLVIGALGVGLQAVGGILKGGWWAGKRIGLPVGRATLKAAIRRPKAAAGITLTGVSAICLCSMLSPVGMGGLLGGSGYRSSFNESSANRWRGYRSDPPMANKNYREDFAFWTSEGYTPEQAAGIIANMEHESGGNPRSIGDNGKAYGLFQWHPSRREKISQGLRDETGGRMDFSTAGHMDQLAAAAWEMKHFGEYTDKAHRDDVFNDAYFRSLSTAYDAGAYFCRKFEIPADTEGAAARRGSLAERIVKKYYAGEYDAPAAGGNNISALDPRFQAPVSRVLSRLRDKGWDPVIRSGVRTQSEQDEKVAQGLSATRNSKHLDGLAADITDRKLGWDIPKDHPFWKDLQAIAEDEGLVSGARWRLEKDGIDRDVAHIQLGRRAGTDLVEQPSRPGRSAG